MIDINGNAITMTRGDTLIANIDIYDDDGNAYQPTEGDTVRFALKSAQMTIGRKEFVDRAPLILKAIPIDTLILQIDPEDTTGLDFGNYIYDIELTHADGVVDTFIADSSFVIAPEVH